ncbi:MAG: DUF4153 domain-containing protein [Gemmatimonadales bacterium]
MSTMTERTKLGLDILGAAAVLGIASDALLRATPWGLNAFLCTAGLVSAVAWMVRRRRAPVSADAPWLAVTALLLGSNFVARDSGTLRAFDTIGLGLTCSIAYLSLHGIGLRGRKVRDYVRAGIATAASACAGTFPLVGRDVTWSELPSGGALRRARAVGVGGLIAFPLLFIFGALFASADPVFGNVITGVMDVDFAALGLHAFWIAFWTALAAGYLWGGFLHNRSRPGALAGRGLSLSIVPVGTALGLLDLLFLVFVVVQLRYFFGGAELIRDTTGLTYAEYARRGFFELVTASALALPTLLGANWALRHEAREHRRTFRQLAGLLLVLLAVVIASALGRMWLYVEEFGLSEIRLYSTAFMAYLAGVFAWFGWTVLRGRQRQFAFGALVQGFAVLAGLHLLNPDAFIVRTNLARPPNHRPFDAAYAASLSADAVPDLLAALPRLDTKEQCRAASKLLARWTRGAAGVDDDWRNWNLARARARRAVGEAAASLRALPCSEYRR